MYAAGSSESLEPVYKSKRHHIPLGWELCRSTGCTKVPEISNTLKLIGQKGYMKQLPYCGPTNVRRHLKQ